MEPTAIKLACKTKKFDKFYIFTGPEWKVQRIYLEHIAEASQKELKYIDSISSIYSKLNSRAFIAKHYVYVVRDDVELMQSEELQTKLETMIKDDILVLLVTAVDKRTKFYKKYKDKIIEFNYMTVDVLKKYVKKAINLSDKNAEKLIEVCEQDLGRCLLEIDKIFMSKDFDIHKDDHMADIAFEKLLADGTIYTPPKDAIFDFVDAVLDRKINRAFDLYEQCKAVNEATMVMLSVLYNNAKAVLQVQNCTGDVAKVTGLTSWQIMGARKHLNTYRNSELLTIMDLCQECQQKIVTGLIDEVYAVDYILVSVL